MSQYLRKDVVKMAAYTPGEQINNATKLNTNECAWGPAPGVLKALAKCPVDALRLYPRPTGAEAVGSRDRRGPGAGRKWLG